MKQHQPKGSMCQTCCGGSRACAALPFASMPVIKAYPGRRPGGEVQRPPADRPRAIAALPELRRGGSSGLGRGRRIALRSLSRLLQHPAPLDRRGKPPNWIKDAADRAPFLIE